MSNSNSNSNSSNHKITHTNKAGRAFSQAKIAEGLFQIDTPLNVAVSVSEAPSAIAIRILLSFFPGMLSGALLRLITLPYWPGWVLLGLFIVASFVSLWVATRTPAERVQFCLILGVFTAGLLGGMV